MIFAEPELEGIDHQVLELIREQRVRLGRMTTSYPRRWMGSLRRNTFAKAIQGSNSIEGYNATLDDAVAAIEEEPPLDERTETWFAIKGYRDAMTYIMQTASDDYFEFSKQFLKSLHFMMVGFDLSANPGQWRPGAVYVVNRASGRSVYEGPDAEIVDQLINELVAYLKSPPAQSTIVKAAMAHLNLTLIRPFSDGNGRMARALQTLMLSSEGFINPVFSSIEEWLGRNTEEYYATLATVGRGSWQPKNDALPWVRFCLRAHYQQAGTVLRRYDEYESLYGMIEGIIEKRELHERMAAPLFDCALGLRMTNSRYQSDVDVSGYIAGRDLKILADKELIIPHGERRGRYYVAGEDLRNARKAARRHKESLDPYELIKKKSSPEVAEPRLPGL